MSRQHSRLGAGGEGRGSRVWVGLSRRRAAWHAQVYVQYSVSIASLRQLPAVGCWERICSAALPVPHRAAAAKPVSATSQLQTPSRIMHTGGALLMGLSAVVPKMMRQRPVDNERRRDACLLGPAAVTRAAFICAGRRKLCASPQAACGGALRTRDDVDGDEHAQRPRALVAAVGAAAQRHGAGCAARAHGGGAAGGCVLPLGCDKWGQRRGRLVNRGPVCACYTASDGAPPPPLRRTPRRARPTLAPHLAGMLAAARWAAFSADLRAGRAPAARGTCLLVFWARFRDFDGFRTQCSKRPSTYTHSNSRQNTRRDALTARHSIDRALTRLTSFRAARMAESLDGGEARLRHGSR